jgi:hypothetical protein
MLDPMTTTLEKVKDIPGLMTPEELSLLCRMARSGSSILELGSYKGKSLAAMGLTNPNAKLYGIDWFGDMSHRGYQGSTFKETQGNLEKHGVKAEFIIGTTDEAAGQFEKTVDLLHIDAGHSYEECTNDLKNYTPKVNPGGAVCIHDYGKARNSKLDRPEVQQAVDDWRNADWTEVERAGTMIAFRKIVAEEGVLYIAYGERAVANAEQSIASLKEWAPRLMVAVASDQQVKGADIWIKHVDIDRGARNVKTRMYAISPFRKTLFLDADTFVLSDPAHGFKMLDLVDMVMGQDAVRIFNRTTWAALDKDEVATTKSETDGGELCYYNTGVIFFRRSEAMRQLMQAWHKEWLRWGKQDQPGLLRAMYKHPVRMASMRAPWNTHHQADAKFIFHAHRRASREGAPK